MLGEEREVVRLHAGIELERPGGEERRAVSRRGGGDGVE